MPRFKNKLYGVMSSLEFNKRRVRILYYVLFVFLLIAVFVSIAPPLWVMLSSLKDIKEFYGIPPTIIPRSFHPEKLIEVWQKLKFEKLYFNSFVLVGGCVVCAITFNGLIAYVLSILKPRGRKVIFYLILGSLMMPPTISIVPLFKDIVALKQINSFLPLWLSYGANAFFVVLYKSFYDNIPVSLVEAAKLDGCTNMQLFFSIILPLSKAINMVIVIFALNQSWSDFLLPYLVLKDQSLHTVIVKIFTMSSNRGLPVDFQMMALTFSVIPPVLLFILFQKHITQGIALTGIKE